jgi:hypothetical protein
MVDEGELNAVERAERAWGMRPNVEVRPPCLCRGVMHDTNCPVHLMDRGKPDGGSAA